MPNIHLKRRALTEVFPAKEGSIPTETSQDVGDLPGEDISQSTKSTEVIVRQGGKGEDRGLRFEIKPEDLPEVLRGVEFRAVPESSKKHIIQRSYARLQTEVASIPGAQTCGVSVSLITRSGYEIVGGNLGTNSVYCAKDTPGTTKPSFEILADAQSACQKPEYERLQQQALHSHGIFELVVVMNETQGIRGAYDSCLGLAPRAIIERLKKASPKIPHSILTRVPYQPWFRHIKYETDPAGNRSNLFLPFKLTCFRGENLADLDDPITTSGSLGNVSFGPESGMRREPELFARMFSPGELVHVVALTDGVGCNFDNPAEKPIALTTESLKQMVEETLPRRAKTAGLWAKLIMQQVWVCEDDHILQANSDDKGAGVMELSGDPTDNAIYCLAILDGNGGSRNEALEHVYSRLPTIYKECLIQELQELRESHTNITRAIAILSAKMANSTEGAALCSHRFGLTPALFSAISSRTCLIEALTLCRTKGDGGENSTVVALELQALLTVPRAASLSLETQLCIRQAIAALDPSVATPEPAHAPASEAFIPPSVVLPAGGAASPVDRALVFLQEMRTTYQEQISTSEGIPELLTTIIEHCKLLRSQPGPRPNPHNMARYIREQIGRLEPSENQRLLHTNPQMRELLSLLDDALEGRPDAERPGHQAGGP